MTYPYNEPLFSNFLLVRMTLPLDKLDRFSKYMCELTPRVFSKKVDWLLLRAGIRRDQTGEAAHVVHLWQLPEPANLWEGMYSVAADSTYAQLNKLVRTESQELLRLAPLSPVRLELDEQSQNHFALCELSLVQDWKQVCQWRERLLALNVRKETGPKDWPLYATFRPQTGDLRRQINMWQLDPSVLDRDATWDIEATPESAKLADGTVVVAQRQPIEVYDVLRY
jgi:hypothetical protein